MSLNLTVTIGDMTLPVANFNDSLSRRDSRYQMELSLFTEVVPTRNFKEIYDIASKATTAVLKDPKGNVIVTYNNINFYDIARTYAADVNQIFITLSYGYNL